MKPKSRKEILDICQNNFWKYSTFNKFLIIISISLSATALAALLGAYIFPTIRDIANEVITGWYIVWRVCLAYLLYQAFKYVNLICVAIGGLSMCREENWDHLEFSKAWLNYYKYEESLNDKENSEK